jgi:hypothetical protein
MLKCCHTFKDDEKTKIFHEDISIFQLYIEMIRKIKWIFVSKARKNRHDANLAETKCHLRHFVAYWNKSISFDDYSKQMKKVKKSIQRSTRSLHHQDWADVCFTHLLMFHIINKTCVNEDYFDTMFLDAQEIYVSHDNDRARYLSNYLRQDNHAKFEKTAFTINSDCTIRWIVMTCPRVKSLIRHGISSAERFDVWNPCQYWNTSN